MQVPSPCSKVGCIPTHAPQRRTMETCQALLPLSVVMIIIFISMGYNLRIWTTMRIAVKSRVMWQQRTHSCQLFCGKAKIPAACL